MDEDCERVTWNSSKAQRVKERGRSRGWEELQVLKFT